MRTTLRQAERRFADAEASYSQGRSRQRLRGEKRAAAVAELGDARSALDAARAAFEALPDEARRGGALPGWIRAADEPASPPPS